MCTRYISPEVREIEALWHVGPRNQSGWVRELHPLRPGPFIRRASDGSNDLVVGQWGMIPADCETRIPMSKPRGLGDKPKRLSTVNARSETVSSRPTYRDAWKRGQRCIIPASSFDEPNWETGKNVWWRFERSDGQPWGVAGIWSMWTDPITGEIVPNYTMLTMNADVHPLMNRMHKPMLDPNTKLSLPPQQQDKRSLVLVEQVDFDQWLAGTVEEAKALVQLTPVELFNAGPADQPAAAQEARLLL
jgi:putative SOS response-associated peptidase YedK